jgi:hypothetical protein
MEENSPAWASYAQIQLSNDPESIDKSLARDEALDAVLNDIVADPTAGTESTTRRFYSLCRNRLSKQRRRRQIDRLPFKSDRRRGGVEFGGAPTTLAAHDPLHQLAHAQLVGLLRTVLPNEDVGILLELADGYSYSEMAQARGRTVPSLKAKVFRIRKRVRKSGIAGDLDCWPRG